MNKKLTSCVYGLGGAAFGAGGLFFIVLGLSCLLAAAVSFVFAFKKRPSL